jgi:DNA repair protein RadC
MGQGGKIVEKKPPCGSDIACNDPLPSRSSRLGRAISFPLDRQEQRPRERLFSVGEEALSEGELLAILLGTSGVRGQTVTATADRLLDLFGGAGGLASAEVEELLAAPGVGEARAATIKAALELGRRSVSSRPGRGDTLDSPFAVAKWFRIRLSHLKKEVFWSLGLDSRNRVIRGVRVAEGHLCGVEVHPREAFRPLLSMGAASAIFVHNHPSGDPEPSGTDIALTERLLGAGRLIGIRVLDHLIVGSGGHVSLASRGLVK